MAYFDIFDSFMPFGGAYKQPSVYVISDSEMKAYKERQAKAEVLELRKLVDYHQNQAKRLEENISLIEQEYPSLNPATEEWWFGADKRQIIILQ